jgi:preprotein translocase subunit SecE
MSEKKRGIMAKFKEVGSELKKVTWPSFPDVVKQTGVVIGFVLFFMIVIYGIDQAVGNLIRLIMGQL